jgi:hypothetical protein
VSERPVLRVVSGDATPEEVAAVVAAVAASSIAAAEAAVAPGPRTTSVWAARGYAHRNVRATFTPSTDGWRTSFWPR